MNCNYNFIYKHSYSFFLIALFNFSAGLAQSEAPTKDHVLETYGAIQKPANITVKVRQSTDLCNAEKDVVKLRTQQAKTILESKLNQTLQANEVPIIGIVGGGGGYRAMISTLGFLIGLEKSNFLDTSTYMATVSGSGWCMGSWLAQSYSLSELKEFLRNQVATDLMLKSPNLVAIAQQLYSKINYGQPVNESDVWGCLLAEVLLAELPGEGHQIPFSSLTSKIKSGMYPFPIFTAILDQTTPYEWFEFSPFEVGSVKSESWIPASAFGKKFNQGVSTDTAPEQTLGYILGLSSSAFASNLKDVISLFFDRINLLLGKKCINMQELFSDIGEIQIPAPTTFNFMKNIPGNIHAQQEYLAFFDPGVDVNLGVVPFLRRNVNVYLICDASGSVTNNKTHTLRRAQQYANDNNFKFPLIDYTSIGTDKVSLFYDTQDPEVPVIIYFPNQVQFSTFKFSYTNDEFNELCRSSKDAVGSSYDTILRGITIAIDNLKKINSYSKTDKSY